MKKKTLDKVLEEILEYIEGFSKDFRPEERSHKPTFAQMKSNARSFESAFDTARKEIRFFGKEFLKVLKSPFLQRETTSLYENILMVTEMIWDIKKIGLKQAVDNGLVARTCALILYYQPLNFVYIMCQSEELRKAVAKHFFAYARDRYARRLEVLKSLQNDPILIKDLYLTDPMLAERIDFESRSLAYFQQKRAGELKTQKMYCAFPILTILRLQGESPSRSYKFIHNLLLFAEVPKYGNIAYEEEEIERIEKWDREAVKWFKSL